MRWLGPVLLMLALFLVVVSGADEDAIIPALLLLVAGAAVWYRVGKKSAVPTAAQPTPDELAARLAQVELTLEHVQANLQELREARDFYERLYGGAVETAPHRSQVAERATGGIS